MGIDQALLSEIIKRVLVVARPERIILFGSAATGQMTRDSDIDAAKSLITYGSSFLSTEPPVNVLQLSLVLDRQVP